MSAVHTLRRLFDLHRPKLGLSWVSPVSELDTPLDLGAPGVFVTALVGHMNLIRANRVQVLGNVEIDHLNALETNAANSMLEQLFATGPVCLIVADGLDTPDLLKRSADATGTAILQATASSHEVVGELLHSLARSSARRTSMHGVFIEVMGVGVLLTGPPGVGKSELALELLGRGHRLIADDAPEFALVDPDTVEGSCPPALRDFMEVRGLGIINVCALFGESAVKPRRSLRLIVSLKLMQDSDFSPEERLQGIRRGRVVLGVEIPEVSLPVAPGHNMAVLVECTVRNYILHMKGYDAAVDFAERQTRIMRGEEPKGP